MQQRLKVTVVMSRFVHAELDIDGRVIPWEVAGQDKKLSIEDFMLELKSWTEDDEEGLRPFIEDGDVLCKCTVEKVQP